MKEFYSHLLALCGRIESRWQRYNYASEDFHKVVWELTHDWDPSPLADIENQLELLNDPFVQLNQHRSTFSDFHFQIFKNNRFLIEILNWDGSHVNVHDHDFSGVQFQLKGPSLNVVYDFSEESRHGALRFGQLKVRHAEYWRQGGRSVVRAGDIDPHSVFHLGSPTTSLLIRTLPTARLGSQSNYFPTLAANYYVNSDVQRKKLTGLELLSRTSEDKFKATIEKFLDSQSYSENFFMLLKLDQVLLSENYSDILAKYADRGEHETSIVRSVIINHGVDSLKQLASRSEQVSAREKLALSMVAGSHGRDNLSRICDDLKVLGIDVNPLEDIQTTEADQILDVFGISRKRENEV